MREEWFDRRYINGPHTHRPPYPATQVLGCLAECERMQVSHSFALLKQVRRWEEPVLCWDYEYRRLGIGGLDCPDHRIRSFLSFRLKP